MYDDNIFPFYWEFNVFSIENFKFSFKSWTLQSLQYRRILGGRKLVHDRIVTM